jgi:hypothetical protein
MRLHLGLLAACLLLTGCPNDDDDSSPLDDDDAGADDDDASGDDDDASGDDDDASGDDDDVALDYLDATVPDFDGCSGNQVMFTLGDGSEIGPFTGFFPLPASFANSGDFTQFTIRMGTDSSWAQLSGNYSGLAPDSDVMMQSPASTPGNVVLQASLSEDVLPNDAPEDLSGNYGFVNTNRGAEVGGTVRFDGVVPGPDVAISGTYSGIIQKVVSLSEQVVLLGISGCFSETLHPTN